MNSIAKKLYNAMIAEIMMVCGNGIGFISKTKIESCFEISNRYWTKLKTEIRDYEFEAPADEINFFKNIKPLFISEIEYYSLLYHAELSRENVNDPITLEQLLHRESRRFVKFKAENQQFYDYYKAGETSNDETYFVRANNDFSNSDTRLPVGQGYRNPKENACDPDENATTSHDWLIAKIIALERYDEYLKRRLKELNNAHRMKEGSD